jgi:hypothetical protein
VIDLGLLAQKHGVTLIAPIRLDAGLFEPAPPRVAGTIGRPRRVGARLPQLSALAVDLAQAWQLVELDWYGGTKRSMYATARNCDVVLDPLGGRTSTLALGAST